MTTIDLIEKLFGPLVTATITYVAMKKSNDAKLKKMQTETSSMEINDKIIVSKYNTEQYEDLMKSYKELEDKYEKLLVIVKEFQEERDDWKRKYNIFKNLYSE